MTLNSYLRHSGMSLTEFSLLLDVSKGRLSQLRDSTDWPPDLALRAEDATGGALNASALSSIVARARAA